MATQISARKTDSFYRVWFCIITAVALLVDITPLYPRAIVPKFLADVPQFYYEQFKDPLFDITIARPWFDVFLWLEALVLVPLMTWLIYGLTTDHHLVPVNLLVYGVHTLLTTIPCVAELFHTDLLTNAEKAPLFGFYAPFIVIPGIMVLDAHGRLNNILESLRKASEALKGK